MSGGGVGLLVFWVTAGVAWCSLKEMSAGFGCACWLGPSVGADLLFNS